MFDNNSKYPWCIVFAWTAKNECVSSFWIAQNLCFLETAACFKTSVRNACHFVVRIREPETPCNNKYITIQQAITWFSAASKVVWILVRNQLAACTYMRYSSSIWIGKKTVETNENMWSDVVVQSSWRFVLIFVHTLQQAAAIHIQRRSRFILCSEMKRKKQTWKDCVLCLSNIIHILVIPCIALCRFIFRINPYTIHVTAVAVCLCIRTTSIRMHNTERWWKNQFFCCLLTKTTKYIPTTLSLVCMGACICTYVCMQRIERKSWKIVNAEHNNDCFWVGIDECWTWNEVYSKENQDKANIAKTVDAHWTSEHRNSDIRKKRRIVSQL